MIRFDRMRGYCRQKGEEDISCEFCIKQRERYCSVLHKKVMRNMRCNAYCCEEIESQWLLDTGEYNNTLYLRIKAESKDITLEKTFPVQNFYLEMEVPVLYERQRILNWLTENVIADMCPNSIVSLSIYRCVNEHVQEFCKAFGIKFEVKKEKGRTGLTGLTGGTSEKTSVASVTSVAIKDWPDQELVKKIAGMGLIEGFEPYKEENKWYEEHLGGKV